MHLRATVAAILLGTVVSASAEDGDISGYAGLRGSLAFQNSIRATGVSSSPPASAAVQINGNVGGGGSIFWGMHLPEGFSTELELLYRYVPLSDGTVTLNGTSASVPISGSARLFTPMLNAYWDLPVGNGLGVQPFIGGGAGYAWNELGVDKIGPVVFTPTVHEDSWHFAYNFMAGASMPLSGGARLTAMYRWLHEDTTVPCSGTITCSGAINSHSVDVGVEFSL